MNAGRRGSWPLAVAALLLAGKASAADACLDAPVQGQKLQRAGRLLAAREKFAACAQKACPAEIVRDCTGWMQDATRAMPSIVAAARDASGADVLDTTLSIDGSAAAPLGARAIELDPGLHHLLFHRPGAADVVRDVVLREGEKDRQILVTFEEAASAPIPRPSAPPVQAPSPSPSRPVPASVWIAGGVGLAAMTTFGIVGALGVARRGDDHCDTGCSAPEKSAVDGEFLAADISLGVGVVALGIATWLYVAREPVPAPLAAVLGVLGMPGGASVAGRF